MSSFGPKIASPVGFFRGGLSFLKAANMLVNSDELTPNDAFAYLASHSLELFLKSYLLHVGLSEKKLMKIGHNLEKAWKLASNEGLGIDAIPARWCSTLNSAYDRPFLLRYAKDNTGIVVPNNKQLLKDLDVLLKEVSSCIGLNE